ncbi:MAG: excinuclease ABC subunit UvrB [Fibrobacteres bacterium]|jgi:excinuclease ABC subunit B|nr:excinuclease ABC subunit UvrB [Fibrobacterota bacterium]
MSLFKLESPFKPAGDQPQAIEQITRAFRSGEKYQTLMGVTGSGKTFTMANVIQNIGKPTLIISHNKTLAAQLYQEFKSFFPKNAVEYFVSYYDYYQPEAYVVSSDTYIEKDSSQNDEIDKLRLRATMSLMSRQDVVVVASVSCIYGLGSPTEYKKTMVEVKVGDTIERNELLRKFVDIYYGRNDFDFRRGTFRVRGDVVEVHPAYDDFAYRFEFFGDEVEKIRRINLITGEEEAQLDKVLVYPARHYVTSEQGMDRVLRDIRHELDETLKKFTAENKLLEAQRLNQRTMYDMEMLKEVGHCPGVENYSRIIENRAVGSPPSTLIDFFGDDYLLIIDESHVSIPQIGAMYNGDRSRKENLVNYGFRLPCALDNRPLKFHEFEAKMPATLFVSATPADYELRKTGGEVVEQIIRPTGLLDPEIEVRPTKGQIDDILNEIAIRTRRGERTLVTTLTKRSAEDLTDYMLQAGLKVRYMHSDTDTLTRSEIVKELREGAIDILVGINLLREGLDLPEVSLVVILDADKEGFLRSNRSLIQTIGRAARNLNGRVLLYADKMTDSMSYAITETENRRRKQAESNARTGMVPRSVQREIHKHLQLVPDADYSVDLKALLVAEEEAAYEADAKGKPQKALPAEVEALRKQMREAAANLEYEKAAHLRDRIRALESK